MTEDLFKQAIICGNKAFVEASPTYRRFKRTLTRLDLEEVDTQMMEMQLEEAQREMLRALEKNMFDYQVTNEEMLNRVMGIWEHERSDKRAMDGDDRGSKAQRDTK